MITFSNEAARRLWQGFTEKKLARAAWKLIREFHGGISPVMEIEEELIFLALSDEPDVEEKIRSKLQSLVATLMRPEYSRLAAWAERALPRLRERVQAAEGNLWKLAAQTAFERGANIQAVEPAEIPAFLRQSTTTALPVGVRLFGRSIEFSYPPASDSASIEVPGEFPLRIRYAAKDTFEDSREVALWGTGAVQGEIPRARELYIKAVGGRTYRAVPVEDSTGGPRVFLVGPELTESLRAFLSGILRENRFEVITSDDQAFGPRDALVYVVSDAFGPGWVSRAKTAGRRAV